MENNVSTHLAMFGNTKGIMDNEAVVTLDRLEKIQSMLFWNKNKIDNLNNYVSNPGLFDTVWSLRDNLRFHHKVRSRLIGMWNNELNKLKL